MTGSSLAVPAPGWLLSTSAVCCPFKLVTPFGSAGNQRVSAVVRPFCSLYCPTALKRRWSLPWDSRGTGREALPCHLVLGILRHVPH